MITPQTRPARLRRVALLLPVLALVLAGCGGSKGIQGPAAVKLPVSKQVLLVSGKFNGDAGTTMEGQPQFVNGCLGFTSDGNEYVAVWPDGTKITSEKDDTAVVDGHALTPGSTATMKVSIVHTPFPKQFPKIPLYCLGSQVVPVAWVQRVTKVQE